MAKVARYPKKQKTASQEANTTDHPKWLAAAGTPATAAA
jgi:hypothetical protein